MPGQMLRFKSGREEGDIGTKNIVKATQVDLHHWVLPIQVPLEDILMFE
jgi:hypothetical protein